MLSRTILLVLLAAWALWCGVSQHRFFSEQIACQEAAQFLGDYWLVLFWVGSRLVTCARDAGEMVFFTPS